MTNNKPLCPLFSFEDPTISTTQNLTATPKRTYRHICLPSFNNMNSEPSLSIEQQTGEKEDQRTAEFFEEIESPIKAAIPKKIFSEIFSQSQFAGDTDPRVPS